MEKTGSVRAVVFDAYGTLFDVYSVGLLAEQLFPGRGEALAVLWRDKQLEYTRICSMSGRYRPFWELTRAGLRFAAQRLGLGLDTPAEEQLMAQREDLAGTIHMQPSAPPASVDYRIAADSVVMLDHVAVNYVEREELLSNAARRTPLGATLTPEDVAGAVYLLCLPEARMITGHTLVVDGGFSISG